MSIDSSTNPRTVKAFPPIGSLVAYRCTALYSSRSLGLNKLILLVVALVCTSTGCHCLCPKPIQAFRNNLPDSLNREGEPQIERGVPRTGIDAVGWVIGIPSKLLLWNRRVDNHYISTETEVHVSEYLRVHELDEIKVRLNQYRPIDDWRRLTRNTSVAWPWRYTFGVATLVGETIVPGRIFGGDHFNPYTGTIHLYSDLPVIALHESAHALDFSRRKYPGTYAAMYGLPLVPLFHESVASRDVMAYLEQLGDPELSRQANYVLYPAYGTYIGNAVGFAAPVYSTPLYLGSVLGGHAVGRWKSHRELPQAIE